MSPLEDRDNLGQAIAPKKKTRKLRLLFLLALFSCAALGAVILLQAFYWRAILALDAPLEPSDAIVAFNGSYPRVRTAYRLANRGLASNLLISPTPSKRLALYNERFGLRASVRHVPEPNARTTFENALLCAEIIQREGWKKVILVTHDCHMPRAYFLMRCMLLGQGVEVQRSKVRFKGVSGKELSPADEKRILFNEMLDFWGSLGEWALYKCRGSLPEKSGSAQGWLLRLKTLFQFDMTHS